MQGNNDVIATARAWRAQDPDELTGAELDALIAGAESGDGTAHAELADRFRTRLRFGTAGLRARMGAGSNRMNRVVVAQAAAGLAEFLCARSRDPLVVIGYDGRRNSAVFARDSAEILVGAGVRVLLMPRMLPTPMLAFAVRHCAADAGVMVTASHNPPYDNGYKVYLGGDDDGSQIIPPTDAAIAAAMDRVAETRSVLDLPRSDGYEIAPDTVIDAYAAATAHVAPAPEGAIPLRWVYTAMHGVGTASTLAVMEAAGYAAPILVPEQAQPDPDFPTLAFPNPEEAGTMDLAFRSARDAGAELVIAHDPDADRLGVGIPADVPGGWRRLGGNEVGLLLGWRAARAAAGTPGASLSTSIVSSPALAAVAAHYGLDCHETLTGFKWISRAPGIVFGFEEALGYLVNPRTLRDKDGISASVAFLHLATETAAAGRTIDDLLADFAATFGHFATAQVTIRVPDPRRLDDVMGALRLLPPTAFGDDPVHSIDDFRDPTISETSANILRYRLASGSRVIVRPSGTEPKLKVYIDAQGESAMAAESTVGTLESAVRSLLDRL